MGSTTSVKTNARVIAATHRNLEEQVANGFFREDLFFRINVIKLSLPVLAERKEDISLLIDYFIQKFNILKGKDIIGLSQRAMAAAMLYDWPGNVRELENAIEHAFVLSREPFIRLTDLPEAIHPKSGALQIPSGLTLKGIEKHAILQALVRNNWKKMATARELGIDKNTLRRKINRLDIKVM